MRMFDAEGNFAIRHFDSHLRLPYVRHSELKDLLRSALEIKSEEQFQVIEEKVKEGSWTHEGHEEEERLRRDRARYRYGSR